MKNFTNFEDLKNRTLAAQNKIKVGGKNAIEAHFELNQIAGESENPRDETEKANAEFNENNKQKLENTAPKEKLSINTENKEKSFENNTIGPIYMVYRDNMNWEKYAPKIIEHIEIELGGDINVMAFPRGTDEKEIKSWYEDNKDNFEGKFLLTDNTCNPNLESDKYKKRFELDSILQNSNEEVVKKIFKEAFGEKGKDALGYSSLESRKDSYTKLFRLSLEKNTPNKVTFITNKFGHHADFLNPGNRSLQNDNEVLLFTKKCLLDAGYPESHISTLQDVEKYPNPANLSTFGLSRFKEWESQYSTKYPAYPEKKSPELYFTPEEVELMKSEWFFIDRHNAMADIYREQGLNVIQPDEVSKAVKPDDDEIEKNIVSLIDNKFKKINSIEEFISSYGSDPKLYSQNTFTELLTRVGDEEKLVTIYNYVLDLTKNNPMSWMCRKILRDMNNYKDKFQFSEQSKEQIKKRSVAMIEDLLKYPL